jgi:chemotaxis protein methyltransferase CheR
MRPAAAATAIADAAAATRAQTQREFPFSEREFDKITRALYDEAGIDMPRSKEPLVYSRLAKRLRHLGMSSFAEYIKRLDDPDAHELEHLLVALTTNVTKFFREPHHFDDLRANVMPELAERARRGGRVRMWSAGCSSGEEPYSIALTVLQAFPEAGGRDFKILASDINTKVVKHARAGIYPRKALETAPKELVSKYFHDAGPDALEASDALCKLIAFRTLNLMGDWPMRGQFDVVFCRNVTIYFNEQTQATIWRRIAEKLAPGGKLYIGHSERISGPAVDMLTSEGVTAYRRKGAQA